MALDPAAVALLQQMEEAGGPALNELSPEESREAAQGFAELGGPGDDVADQSDRTIPGSGGAIPIRVYTPDGDGPFPCLVYFHGGGWVIGDLEMVNAACRNLSARTGCVVVSVDYRLSPEHKYPQPFDDCFEATKWVVEHGDEIGVDGTRVAVGGDSAGGNLAAAVSLRARDEGGPALAMQLLVYPVANHGYDTDSYTRNGENYLLTTDMMKWFWDHYLGSDADGENPYVSPLRADDVSNLPSATVFTAEFDPLCDEGEAYAAKLTDAGVDVRHTRFDGQIHGFFPMLLVFEAAGKAIDMAAADLKSAFGIS
ncbi:MAG: acetyl esterase [Ilumatobacter sp.]|jgi:acetyl esterase